ncbi:MAG: phage holin family protein [Pseudomonadales bacterium]|nr:phage holin family protein [Pseudomonadales bacterium]
MAVADLARIATILRRAPAFAAHGAHYIRLVSAELAQFKSEIVRGLIATAAAVVLASFTLATIIAVAIVYSWPTDARWWVVGGILLVLAGSMISLMRAARRAWRSLNDAFPATRRELAADRAWLASLDAEREGESQ